MPPKKRGSSKKPAQEKTPTLLNGLTKDEMSMEQLEEFIVRLREDLDREREERNYFQLERDMNQSFSQVQERKLAEVKAELQNLEKEMEEDEAHHQAEVKVNKQKMKHLLFEHQNTICELEADGVVSAEVERKEQDRVEKELHQETLEFMVDTQSLQYETLVEEVKMKHHDKMAAAKKKWEDALAELAEKSTKEFLLMQQEQENLRETAISEREHAWNSHIAALQEETDKTFQIGPEDIRDKEMEIMKLMKSISEKKKVQERKEKELSTLLQENKHLEESVTEEENKQSGVQKKIKYYSEKTDTLDKAKIKKLTAMRREEEALLEKFNKLQLEKEEIQRTLLERMQQKAGVESLRLEEEVQAPALSVEETQAQLSSTLSASNLDPPALRRITGQAPESFDSLNTAIKNRKGSTGFTSDL